MKITISTSTKDLLQLWMTDKTLNLMEERRPYKNIDNNAYNNIKG